MPALVLGELRAKIPVVQGGMGVGISLSSLASAVANAGGIGVISTVGLGLDRPEHAKNPLETCVEAIREEIRRAREKTKGILGVNIMVASSNFATEVRAAIGAGIDIIFSGAGLPLDLPRYLEQGVKTKLVPIVSSAKAARVLLRQWTTKYGYAPDAFVVEGPLAGGHLGFKREQIDDPAFALEKLVPQVLDEVTAFEQGGGKHIPVIAAGGIFTGADIYRMLQLGASGVQMGTRFVCTHECDASPAFKQAYLDCEQADIGIISSPVGMPGRAIRNDFIRMAERGEKVPFHCPYQCIITCDHQKSPYCIALALLNAKRGNLGAGYAFAGANACRIRELTSVPALIAELSAGYAQASMEDKA
ncbi:MAG: nitronate monooxygenase [Clostridiales bacterium]|nr:nitronate monooxygenase [Clostridiales bacterium]